MRKKGMTLIEVITAAVIFSIASLMMLNGFMLASNVLNESVEVSRAGSELARRLETDSNLQTSNGAISFTAGGKSFSISVQYKTASQDINSGVTETRTKFGVRP